MVVIVELWYEQRLSSLCGVGAVVAVGSRLGTRRLVGGGQMYLNIRVDAREHGRVRGSPYKYRTPYSHAVASSRRHVLCSCSLGHADGIVRAVLQPPAIAHADGLSRGANDPKRRLPVVAGERIKQLHVVLSQQ